MKKPNLIYIFVPIIIVLLLLTIPLLPVYNIKNVEIENEFKKQAEEILEKSGIRIGSNIFVTLLSKGNIFTMRFTEAEQKLTKAFIHFGNIKVKAELPSSVLIEYYTKEPVFEIEYGDIYLVTDINGCVLSSRDEHKLGFTRITGMDISGFVMGYKLGDDFERFEYASKIYSEMEVYDKNKLTAFREYIEWIDLSNNSNTALMYDGRILVKFDNAGDISYQTAEMCVILSQQIEFSKEGVLDFTLGDNPVFSEK